MQEQTNKKALWIFENFRETINVIPQKYRGRAWEILIEYGFNNEIDLSKENNYVKLAVKSLLPLMKLRGVGGSQNGKSNNPSGKNKANIGANVGANIGANAGAIPLITENINKNININKKENKKENITEIKNKYGEFENVFLTENQYKKLKVLYKDKLNEAINILSSYLASKGKKYKNYYAVLGENNWVYKKLQENYNKKESSYGSGLF